MIIRYRVTLIMTERFQKQGYEMASIQTYIKKAPIGNDSNLLIVFYVQIMPDDLVMQLHRF